MSTRAAQLVLVSKPEAIDGQSSASRRSWEVSFCLTKPVLVNTEGRTKQQSGALIRSTETLSVVASKAPVQGGGHPC